MKLFERWRGLRRLTTGRTHLSSRPSTVQGSLLSLGRIRTITKGPSTTSRCRNSTSTSKLSRKKCRRRLRNWPISSSISSCCRIPIREDNLNLKKITGFSKSKELMTASTSVRYIVSYSGRREEEERAAAKTERVRGGKKGDGTPDAEESEKVRSLIVIPSMINK